MAYKPISKPRYNKGCYFGESYNPLTGTYKITSGSYYSAPSGYGILEDNKDNKMAYGGILELDKDIIKRDYTGNFSSVPKCYLSNKSVAFYFASIDNAKCRSFTPFLAQFYKSINQASPDQKIEIILVSLDKTEQKYNDHIKAVPWAVVEYNSDLRQHLIKRYNVKEDSEDFIYGTPVTGLPKLVVVGKNGEKLHWLSCDNNSPAILREWDFHANKWP